MDAMMRMTVVLVVTLSLGGNALAETWELGGLYTYHYRDGRYADWGDYARHGALIAVQEIERTGLLGDDRLSLRPERMIDYHCWPDDAAAMAETLIDQGVLALTGVDCSGPAVEIARVAARHGVPAISNGANASALSSTEDFPWFVRVVTPSEAYEGVLVDVAAHYGVREIAHLHTTDAWGLGARRVIAEAADRHGITIARRFGFARDTEATVVEAHLREIRDAGIRHVVMTGPTPDTVTVFRGLHALGMNRAGTSLYAAEMISADEAPDAVAGGLGYLAPIVALPDSPALEGFRAALEARLGHTVDPASKAFFYGALSYDHILAVGHAIRSIRAAGARVDRASLMAALRQMNFDGATGRVRLAPGTNDRATLPVRIVNAQGYGADGRVRFVDVGSVDPETGAVLLDDDRMLWPGDTRVPPGAPQPAGRRAPLRR
jgi:ABC-type branched-subunit amino acid transport system substrate-binding protein